MPTAFVTGGTGFLGLNLVRELSREGWKVVALHRPTSNLRHLKEFDAELVEGTIHDRGSLLRAIPEGADAVFHVAANTSMWRGNRAEQERDNVEGTRNVVEASLARKVRRFIHTSTLGVWGVPPGPIDETTPQGTRDDWFDYVRTKRLAEVEVRAGIEKGLDAVILNPTNIIGDYDPKNWGRFFLMIDRGELPGAPPGTATFCHGRAVARGHRLAWEKGRRGENYILGGVVTTYAEVVGKIAKILGKPAPRVLPAFAFRIVGALSELAALFTRREPDVTSALAFYLSSRTVGRSEKAIAELGYEPAALDLMLDDCHRWLTKERLLAG